MGHLNPDALAQSGTDLDERPTVQAVTEDMIYQYVIEKGSLPVQSARAFAAWLDEVWNDFNEDGKHTNRDVIDGALAAWRGNA
ncbi:hypothetical protein DN402_31690 [Streptomyces sp. SW4]|nr:hypothetical protein DN402_31690 [Streptomyces sp. SW4]